MKIINQNLRTINLLEFVPDAITTRSGNKAKYKLIRKKDNFEISKPYNRKKSYLPNFIVMEPEDFIGIGMYFAEGDKHLNSPGPTSNTGCIGIVNSDAMAVKTFCSLLNKLNIPSEEFSFKIGLNINFKIKVDKINLLNYWTKKLNLNPNKKRPKWIYYTGKIGNYRNIGTSEKGHILLLYNSTILRSFFLNFITEIFDICIKNKYKEELSLILKGFFAGDGSVSYNEKPRRKQVDFLNKDQVLLNKIRESLKILGLKSIKETWPKKTRVNSKALRIYNYHDFKILQDYEILELIGYKKKTFEKLMKSYENTPKTFFKIK